MMSESDRRPAKNSTLDRMDRSTIQPTTSRRRIMGAVAPSESQSEKLRTKIEAIDAWAGAVSRTFRPMMADRRRHGLEGGKVPFPSPRFLPWPPSHACSNFSDSVSGSTILPGVRAGEEETLAPATPSSSSSSSFWKAASPGFWTRNETTHPAPKAKRATRMGGNE